MKYMPRYLTIDDMIFINQYVQGLYSLEEEKSWFKTLVNKDKQDVICDIFEFVVQSHPTYKELQTAIIELQLEKSTPAVKLLNPRKPFLKFGYEVSKLPEKDLTKAFLILMKTLCIADNRRKQQEPVGTCRHWWHKDLSDKTYVNKVKRRY